MINREVQLSAKLYYTYVKTVKGIVKVPGVWLVSLGWRFHELTDYMPIHKPPWQRGILGRALAFAPSAEFCAVCSSGRYSRVYCLVRITIEQLDRQR